LYHGGHSSRHLRKKNVWSCPEIQFERFFHPHPPLFRAAGAHRFRACQLDSGPPKRSAGRCPR